MGRAHMGVGMWILQGVHKKVVRRGFAYRIIYRACWRLRHRSPSKSPHDHRMNEMKYFNQKVYTPHIGLARARLEDLGNRYIHGFTVVC
jgi:hypothetical protein